MCISLDDVNENREPDPTPKGLVARPSAEALEAIVKLLKEEGGAFGLVYGPESDTWTAALEWGREAPDSPLAAAAAYGVDEVPALAVEMALRDAGR